MQLTDDLHRQSLSSPYDTLILTINNIRSLRRQNEIIYIDSIPVDFVNINLHALEWFKSIDREESKI